MVQKRFKVELQRYFDNNQDLKKWVVYEAGSGYINLQVNTRMVQIILVETIGLQTRF